MNLQYLLNYSNLFSIYHHRKVNSENDGTALAIQPFFCCSKIPELLFYHIRTFWNVIGKHIGASPWVGKGMDLKTNSPISGMIFILVEEFLDETENENLTLKEQGETPTSSDCN